MHIHILGICGTFMGSLAQLAVAMGHRVTGSDANVYPPMSTQLADAGIQLIEGYDPGQLDPAPDLVVIGNVLSRGNPCVEYVLNKGLNYTSGPQWLGEHCLPGRWVLAVAGTHGKTTTASMLAWILEYAGLKPGYLIGGVPKNFGVSARLGDSPFFVVEADEYDTAFFDKRSKFVHYHPRTLVLNNLEYDHADIFPDLAAIQTQFHHLLRTVPSEGLIISPADVPALVEVLEKGCWTPVESIGEGAYWQARLLDESGGKFEVWLNGGGSISDDSSASDNSDDSDKRKVSRYEGLVGTVTWPLSGKHNVANGMAAIVAARHAGVPPDIAVAALGEFAGVKRRMETLANINGVTIYDDFAHHPTAIATTLQGLRKQVGGDNIIAVIEPRSNTMKLGIHRDQLAASTAEADQVFWYQPTGFDWSLDELVGTSTDTQVLADMDRLLEAAVAAAKPGSHIVIMSNGGFGGFHQRLIAALG